MPLRKPEMQAKRGRAARTATTPKETNSRLAKSSPSQDSTAIMGAAIPLLEGAVNETTVNDAAALGFTPGQLKGDPLTAHQNANKATDIEASRAIAEWGKVVNWQRAKQAQLGAIKEEFNTVKAGANAVSAGYQALTAIEGTKQSVIEFRTSVEKTAQKLDTLGLETFRTGENRKQIASQKQEIGFNTESAMHKASIAQQKAVELKEKAEALTTVARPAA
jgi:hypothetical protein